MTNKICDLCSSKIKKGDKIKDIEIDDEDILYFHSKCLTEKFLDLLNDSFELKRTREVLDELQELINKQNKELNIELTLEKSKKKKWENILKEDTEIQQLLNEAEEVLKNTK
jgi:hypothetical protein